MKIKNTVTVMIFVFIIVALATIIAGATIGFPTSAFAGEEEQQERFIAELTGVEEVLLESKFPRSSGRSNAAGFADRQSPGAGRAARRRSPPAAEPGTRLRRWRRATG